MKKAPLVLVFYIDRETMQVKEIMEPFIESINMYIESREYDVMALFMPTDGEERVECINPVIATEEQLEKINALIDDIELKFSIGDNDKTEETDEENSN